MADVRQPCLVIFRGENYHFKQLCDNLQRTNIKTKLYPYDGPDTVTGYSGNGGAHEFYFNITIESPQEAVDEPKLPEKFSSFNKVAQYIRGFLQAHKYSVED